MKECFTEFFKSFDLQTSKFVYFLLCPDQLEDLEYDKEKADVDSENLNKELGPYYLLSLLYQIH